MLWGEKGVGKTYAMDSSARCLTGLGEEDKVNQLIDVRALGVYPSALLLTMRGV